MLEISCSVLAAFDNTLVSCSFKSHKMNEVSRFQGNISESLFSADWQEHNMKRMVSQRDSISCAV
jgi:hypothetical protein